MKKKGFGTTDHTPAISPEDMKQLYAPGHPVFATTVPVGLQRKVWFELMMYLCRRGRENLRDMTRDTFCVDTDASGRRYVYQKQGEFTKTTGKQIGPMIRQVREECMNFLEMIYVRYYPLRNT